MGRRCAIEGCINRKGRPNGTVHSFPSKPDLLNRWISISVHDPGRPLKLKNFGVCMLHFLPQDYVNYLPTISPDFHKKGSLKPNALPSQDLCHMRQQREAQTIKNNSNSNYVKVLEKRERRHKMLIVKKNRQLMTLRKNLSDTKAKLFNAKNETKNAIEVLGRYFTPTQLRIVCGNYKKHVNWPEEDLRKAITLFAVSAKSYVYMRDTLSFPLPSISTVYYWLSKIEVQPGHLITPVIQVLKAEFSNAPSLSRIGVLAFDEMAIDSRYCYDVKTDSVLGKHEDACVTAIRGLFYKWKQIIHFDFGKTLQQDNLFSMIKILYEAGIDIRAMVSDMGPKNQRVWRDLDVGKVRDGELNKTWFIHPVTGKRIWVFADYPHLLKLLRNHVLDNGITFPDGATLNKNTLLKLLEAAQKREFTILPNLTYRHVYMTGQQRQNVASAFQLFSNTTSTALPLLVPGSITASAFIKAINDLSDVMNTRESLLHMNPNECAFGLKFEEQNKTLEHAFKFIKEMRVGTRKRGYAPFQKGLLMSIISMKGLLNDTRNDYGAKFIMTSHVNQDYVENYFSQIRGMGKLYTNPTALEFQHRLKRIICGKSLIAPTSASVHQSEETDMISSRMFKQLLSHDSSIEKLVTRTTKNALPAEIVIENLTNLDWTVNERDIRLEDCRHSERSDEGGIEFVAGYIAKKFQESYPELADSSTRDGFWIRYLSEGGLCEPSVMWLSLFKKFDQIYRAVSGEKIIDRAPGIVKNLTRLLASNFKDVPHEIIKYFSKIRVFVRIKYLNRLIEDEKFLKQERKREFYRRKMAGETEIADEPMESELRNSEEDLEDMERDLADVERLLQQFTQGSSSMAQEEEISVSLMESQNEVTCQ